MIRDRLPFHQPDDIAVQIIDDDYVESITYYTLKNADQDVTITLTIDNND